eukprot:TRINITY_DN15746_c0_g1_i4.p1 TRINITY_DN15746_c0_g1~~TRINITY_DN15746_c0_g1_i4.p1  ORF type:complete len:258 (-),score=44.77 TRINITY_DN15746_c0_g1_i4:32-805(-)
MVSSDFLQMAALVDACVSYIHRHLQEVVRVPLDLGCVSSTLADRIGAQFTALELDLVEDPKDRLIGKLWRVQIEKLLAEHVLHRCLHCRKVFGAAHMGELSCLLGHVTVDFRGRNFSRHTPDPHWNVNRLLQQLRLTGSWRSMYWRLWGLVHLGSCTNCNEVFPLSELDRCSYHPEPACFMDNHAGVHTCCGGVALKFSTKQAERAGCASRQHSLAVKHLALLETATTDLSLITAGCLLYTSPSPRDRTRSRMPSSA